MTDLKPRQIHLLQALAAAGCPPTLRVAHPGHPDRQIAAAAGCPNGAKLLPTSNGPPEAPRWPPR